MFNIEFMLEKKKGNFLNNNEEFEKCIDSVKELRESIISLLKIKYGYEKGIELWQGNVIQTFKNICEKKGIQRNILRTCVVWIAVIGGTVERSEAPNIDIPKQYNFSIKDFFEKLKSDFQNGDFSFLEL